MDDIWNVLILIQAILLGFIVWSGRRLDKQLAKVEHLRHWIIGHRKEFEKGYRVTYREGYKAAYQDLVRHGEEFVKDKSTTMPVEECPVCYSSLQHLQVNNHE